jgi:hypothetical protein
MMDWFATVSDFVNEAAQKAELKQCLGGFDGDAWVWNWRTQPTGERTSEARLRIRPDSLTDGAQVEVSAAAWIETRRDVATNRVLWSQFFDGTQLQEHSRMLPALSEHLREGRSAAIKLGESLDKLAQRRDDMMTDLKKRDLLEG